MSAASHDAHEGGHGHSPFIQHHYDDAQHQFDAGKLGIWLFLAQEVLFFSALFVAYILYRVHHPEIYSYAHKYLDVKFGAINTAVLIFSSGTAAWAVRAAQLNQRKRLIFCLATTIACACAFLCIKYIEYSHKVHEHILFGSYFDPCVSSGGEELLTKHNECPGSKTTVQWSGGLKDGFAKAGCFPDFTFDQDPRTEGVQAKCTVREAKVQITETKNKDGSVTETEKELSSVAIATQCPEESFGEPEAGAKETKVEKVEKFPCWKVTRQPAVCKPGYFFQWKCTGKCDPKLVGGPAGTAGPMMNLQKCTEVRGDKEAAMKGEKDTYSLTECVQSDNTGILVAYGDHEERGEISSTEGSETEYRIVADCAVAPPAAATTDLMADPGGEHLVLGQKAVKPVKEMSTHEQHEREAAGPPPEHTNMFFTIYFAMTGLHGVHVLLGIFVFIWLLIRAIKGQFTPEYFGPIDYAALYWHIVDLIWIFLFPLLYLIH